MMSHHSDITRYPYNIIPPSTTTSLSPTKSNTAPPNPPSINPSTSTSQTTTSPTRPKHLTTRSISDISSIHKEKTHKHHHHPHLHHRDKERDLSHSVSNLHPGLGLPEALGGSQSKSEGVTPSESRNVSRRGSFMGADRNGNGENWEDSVGGGVRREEKRNVKEGEVERERERGVQRATELRNALIGLNTLSNNTTRRLDNAYYSVLEKLGVLHSTISGLKELANMTRELNAEFKIESEDLVRDVSAQIESFDQFSSQESRIAELAARVKAGRERIKTLGERVDVVKERVEGWEKAEGEWKERTRKNLRIMWIVMAVIGGLLLAIVAFQYTPAMGGMEEPKGLNTTGLLGKIPDFESLKNESRALKKEVEEALNGTRKQLAEDPRLRPYLGKKRDERPDVESSQERDKERLHRWSNRPQADKRFKA
ncbi:uncharacterized protein PAC_15656 [Phialocephala subalpina]|uniref:Uncharacterized protein n=1 Tax=Phialocephala subalpina TaxID=576137 RepID=A0A1L7XLE0_9HELO|nr:uncharacterized protein PAC_15656 [Phialocephala subalpina]